MTSAITMLMAVLAVWLSRREPRRVRRTPILVAIVLLEVAVIAYAAFTMLPPGTAPTP